jgi:mRNA interferase MazF
MREGEIALANLPQADGSYKLRPVLLLKQLPGYNDFLVCGISTQIHQRINDFDELLDVNASQFNETGLRQSSIIRLSFLAVIPSNKIPGSIGKIDWTLHKILLNRLANYLLS